MEIFAIILLILSGGLISFLTSVFNNISLDDINSNSELNDSVKELLSDLNNKQEYSVLGLNFIETSLYVIAGALCGFFFFGYYPGPAGLITALAILFAVIFLQRSILSAVSARNSMRLGIKLSGLLNFLFAIGMFISGIYYKIFVLIAGKEEEDAARDEINAAVESAMEEGSLDEDEYRIMKNAMHFSNVLVSDVMTPRTVIFSLSAEMLVEEALSKPELMMYSRFPIWQGNSLDDGAVGYVVTKDILNAALKNRGKEKLREFSRKIIYMPENSKLDIALEQFIKTRKHLFLVVDEYGGIEGLISMEDVLENILGVEIVDEADRVVDMRELAKLRRDRRVKSMLPTDEVED